MIALAANGVNVDLLFALLAVVAFAVSIYLAFVGNAVGAIVSAFIGVVILLVSA